MLATVITIINYNHKTFKVQATGGSMGPKYVFLLLFSEKSQSLILAQQLFKLVNKIGADLESLEF